MGFLGPMEGADGLIGVLAVQSFTTLLIYGSYDGVLALLVL